MAITDSQSVLILGAGASVPFGLPLGGELIDLIRELIEAEISEFGNQYQDSSGLFFFGSGSSKIDGEAQMMTGVLRGAQHYNYNGWNAFVKPPLENLHGLLTGQTSQTIDDFIAINPDVADLTKTGLAAVLFQHLYTKQENRWGLNMMSGRESPNGRRNWVHHLINLVRHENFDKPTEKRTKVRIISFNYEATLETVLDHQFDNTGHDFGDWREYIEIVHPHGFTGQFETQMFDPLPTIKRWAEAINVVKEKNPSDAVLADRVKAKEWIKDSKDVYMVGFALSGPNASLLGLGSRSNPEQSWHVANYDGSPGLKRTVEKFVKGGSLNLSSPKFNRIIHLPEEGRKGDELHIDTWFSIGVPGQMPA